MQERRECMKRRSRQGWLRTKKVTKKVGFEVVANRSRLCCPGSLAVAIPVEEIAVFERMGVWYVGNDDIYKDQLQIEVLFLTTVQAHHLACPATHLEQRGRGYSRKRTDPERHITFVTRARQGYACGIVRRLGHTMVEETSFIGARSTGAVVRYRIQPIICPGRSKTQQLWRQSCKG